MIAEMGNIAAETDTDLLVRFTRDRMQDAFTELVKRYVNLVYSAALRQVHSPQLAEEIAQSVFSDLARNAGKLKPDTVLAAWLHSVTRRTAVDIIRQETRYRFRQRIAVDMTVMTATESCWLEIEPMLDEAVAALDELDRAAVLLRYFENKSLRQVGAALGVSDDAAQKRVSRAVERLREFFSKRNVTIGASGLTILISAHAVQSAPAGLLAAISAAVLAGTAASTSTTIAATKAIIVTTLQKTLVASTIAVVAGAGIYKIRQATQLRDQVQTLQQQQAPLAEQIQQLQKSLADATNRLASLLAENSQLKSNSNEMEVLKLRGAVTRLQGEKVGFETSPAKAWQERIEKLKAWLDSKPDATIPEFQFLTEDDWLIAIRSELKNGLDYRKAAAQLRAQAESKFVPKLQSALKRYSEQNEGRLPTDITQLRPYFDPPVEDTILARWTVLPAERIADLRLGGDAIVTQKGYIDDTFDTRYGVGPNGCGTTDFLSSDNREAMTALFTAFSSANPGRKFESYSELIPYAQTPAQQSILQKLVEQQAGNK